MYISYRDPIHALEAATALVQAGRWRFHEDPLGRRHVYDWRFDPRKDPILSPTEIVAVFGHAATCAHAHQAPRFFRIEAQLSTPGWVGHGRILFHIEELPGSRKQRRVVVVTAYRIRGWRWR